MMTIRWPFYFNLRCKTEFRNVITRVCYSRVHHKNILTSYRLIGLSILHTYLQLMRHKENKRMTIKTLNMERKLHYTMKVQYILYIPIIYKCNGTSIWDHVGDDMVNVLVSGAVHRWFRRRSGKNKGYTIDICCFSTEHVRLRCKSKDWWARNQDTVSEMRGLLFQWASINTTLLFLFIKLVEINFIFADNVRIVPISHFPCSWRLSTSF